MNEVRTESERVLANSVVTKDSVSKLALFDSNQLGDKFTDGGYGRRKLQDEDADFLMNGALSLTDPNPPTKEQIEAEVKTHKQLFPGQYRGGKHTRYDISPVVEELRAESEKKTANAPVTKDSLAEMTLFDTANNFGVAAANTNEHLPPTARTYFDPHMEVLYGIEAEFGISAACSEEGPCSLEEAFSGQCISTEICAARDTTPLDLSRLGSDRAQLLMAMTKS
jgi:hypothetical protein